MICGPDCGERRPCHLEEDFCGQPGRRAGRSESETSALTNFFKCSVSGSTHIGVCVDAQLVLSLSVVVFSVRV